MVELSLWSWNEELYIAISHIIAVRPGHDAGTTIIDCQRGQYLLAGDLAAVVYSLRQFVRREQADVPGCLFKS